VASASISLVLHYFLAQLLDMTTGLQLVELSRPDHPLLQFILRNAPGTYQHSLQLANLVEQAAERIDANGSLARVGALYHDAGKALNPYFFIENQPLGNLNPHDDLDPLVSASTIIRHVTDGITLARKCTCRTAFMISFLNITAPCSHATNTSGQWKLPGR
jgi:putative nucleotidyltransferase with HDIG domain